MTDRLYWGRTTGAFAPEAVLAEIGVPHERIGIDWREGRTRDPEDLRIVIGDCQRLWETCIRRYEGFVARYMGDGLLVYFGYPHAHEDDAERAVLSALDIIDAMERLRDSESVKSEP